MPDHRPAVVGIGTSALPRAPHLDAVGHHVVAMCRALDDAGIDEGEVDGYCCAGGSKESFSAPSQSPMAPTS